jgi:hypothetical protein
MAVMEEQRVFGPKTPTHPSVGEKCPACGKPFVAGDMTTLIALGPGDDPVERAKADVGEPYNAVAVEVHAACAR